MPPAARTAQRVIADLRHHKWNWRCPDDSSTPLKFRQARSAPHPGDARSTQSVATAPLPKVGCDAQLLRDDVAGRIDHAAVKIDKPRLPKDRAYALKTSLLEATLRELNVTCDVVLDYWTPRTGGSFFDVEYWLANDRRPTTLYVRAGSLPGDEAGGARRALTTTVLPQFAEWLDSILKLPDGSPLLAGQPPSFRAEMRDGAVVVFASGLRAKRS
jgi:hypothetical protein